MADCGKCNGEGVIRRAKRPDPGFVASEFTPDEAEPVETYEVLCDCEHGTRKRALRERRAIKQEIEAAPEWDKDYVRSIHEGRLERLNRIIRGETDFSPDEEEEDDGSDEEADCIGHPLNVKGHMQVDSDPPYRPVIGTLIWCIEHDQPYELCKLQEAKQSVGFTPEENEEHA